MEGRIYIGIYIVKNINNGQKGRKFKEFRWALR